MKIILNSIIKKYRSFKKQNFTDLYQPGDARRKKRPNYKSFRLYRHIKPNKFVALPSSFKVFKDSLVVLKKNKKLFLVYVLVMGLLQAALVKGFNNNFALGEIKDVLNSAGLSVTNLYAGVLIFASLITSSNTLNSDIATLYQGILFIIGSLSVIWIIRKINSNTKEKITVKKSYYYGMGQLVQFLIVLFVITIELIPLIAGFGLVNLLMVETVSFSATETFAILTLCFSLALLSLYMISGSVAAMYIVTLPNAVPIKSIIASNQLLALHRWSVMRKLLMLCVYLFVINGIFLIPIIIFLPSNLGFIAEYTFLFFSIINFVVFHNFLYTMYKKLL